MKLEFFQFEGFEGKLLAKLRQPISASQLKAFADDLLRPATIELTEINRFLKRLFHDNLLIAENTGWGWNYYRSFSDKQKFNWLRASTGILSIRFRGFNPRALLELLNPITRFLFHPKLIILAGVMFVFALFAFLLNIGQLIGSVDMWSHLSSSRMLIPLGLALVMVKVLHEFGHALACRSVERDCHEMGVMLLAFVPCLYCNVSDVWMEPDRKKRMLVSAAGIYIEMLVAIACVPLWLTCNYQPLQFFFLSAITICSVNTLLINGNPLLRYDGYYLLSDWVGVPNLQTKSRKLLSDRFYRFLSSEQQPSDSNSISWLEIYGIGSQIYRLLVLSLIIGAVYTFFNRIELSNFGLSISFLIVVTTILIPLIYSLRKFFSTGLNGKFNNFKLLIVTSLIAITLIAIANIPVRTSTFGQGEVAFPTGSIVYAGASGQIHWLVAPDSDLNADQEIATIEDHDLELRILDQQQRLAKLQHSLEQSKLLQRQGSDYAREIELNIDALNSAKNIEAELLLQRDELTLRAPIRGRLASLPEAAQQSSTSDLSRTTSTLSPVNREGYVEKSEPVALIAPLEGLTVRIRVSERDARYLSVGQPVRAVVPQMSPDIALGTVTQIGIGESLLRDGQKSARNDSKDEVTVLARLNNVSSGSFHKSKVYATIMGEKLPVYKIISRFVRDNFDF